MNLQLKKLVIQTFRRANITPNISISQNTIENTSLNNLKSTNNSDNICDLSSYLANKKVLFLKPYPSKKRINSKFYDLVMNVFKFSRTIEPKIQSEENVEAYINKIKGDYKFDEIIGISELDEDKTKEFIKENNIVGINFILDENNEFISNKTENKRFELILDNLNVN